MQQDLDDTTSFTCKIYVNEDEIYSGQLGEVPEKFRKGMKRDLSDWAESLGKRGLNELIYSHLAWYEEKDVSCTECGKSEVAEQDDACPDCGGKITESYIYERNKSLDIIITCVGMITAVHISED
jgi:hypothetical protein